MNIIFSLSHLNPDVVDLSQTTDLSTNFSLPAREELAFPEMLWQELPQSMDLIGGTELPLKGFNLPPKEAKLLETEFKVSPALFIEPHSMPSVDNFKEDVIE